MKKILFILINILLLTGCGNNEVIINDYQQQENEENIPEVDRRGMFNLNTNIEYLETVFYLVGVNDICAEFKTNGVFNYSSESARRVLRERLRLPADMPFFSYHCYTDITPYLLESIKMIPGIRVIDNEIKDFHIRIRYICQTFDCDVITNDWLYFDFNLRMLEVKKITIPSAGLEWNEFYPGIGIRHKFSDGIFMRNITGRYQVNRPNILGQHIINGRPFLPISGSNELEDRHFNTDNNNWLTHTEILTEQRCEEFNLLCGRW